MGFFSDLGHAATHPFSGDSILNPFGGGGIGGSFKNLDKSIRDDSVSKFVAAPVKSTLKADPLFQKVTTGRAGSNDTRIRAGTHEVFSEDPLGQHVGVKENDAVSLVKIAGAVAAAYFGYVGAMGALGSMGGAAAVSGEGGAVASTGAGTAAGASVGTGAALTAKDYVAIAGTVLTTANTVAASQMKPEEPPPAPDINSPFNSGAPGTAAARQTRKNTADIGKFDTILTGPLGLDKLGGDATGKRKTILGS